MIDVKRYYIAKKANNNGKMLYLNDFGDQYDDCCSFSEFPTTYWKNDDEAFEYFAIVASHIENVILISKSERLEKVIESDTTNRFLPFDDIAAEIGRTKQDVSQILKKSLEKVVKQLRMSNQEYSYFEIVLELMKYFKFNTDKEIEHFMRSFSGEFKNKIKMSYVKSLDN